MTHSPAAPVATEESRFDAVSAIADTVLYEGYVLYPYRASALKNHFRWQFGTVAPRSYVETRPDEEWWSQVECLIEPGADTRVSVRVRFLQLQTRTIQEKAPAGAWRPVDRLVMDGLELVPWEEGVACTITEVALPLDELVAERVLEREIAGGRVVETISDASGTLWARVLRVREPLRFSIRIAAEPRDSLVSLRVRVENTTPWSPGTDDLREAALRRSLLSCHVLLGVQNGAFLSLIDPPAHAAAAALGCRNHRLWPVLAGATGERDVMLAAPIVLYDYPAVAPESRGDFFDATEIDELLTLRVMTMTDAEKSEAAATDARARVILERVEQSGEEDMARLHGTRRALGEASPGITESEWEALLNPPSDPAPEDTWTVVGSTRVQRGSRVRLVPRHRGDSMDTFLAGRTATVAGVHRDLEDRVFIAVTIDDDQAADLRRALGRFFYFLPDEVEPVAVGTTEGQPHA